MPRGRVRPARAGFARRTRTTGRCAPLALLIGASLGLDRTRPVQGKAGSNAAGSAHAFPSLGLLRSSCPGCVSLCSIQRDDGRFTRQVHRAVWRPSPFVAPSLRPGQSSDDLVIPNEPDGNLTRVAVRHCRSEAHFARRPRDSRVAILGLGGARCSSQSVEGVRQDVPR